MLREYEKAKKAMLQNTDLNNQDYSNPTKAPYGTAGPQPPSPYNNF